VILTHAGLPPEDKARAESSRQVALKATGILHHAGVTLLAGTDQVVPGHSIYRELELLVEAGLTPIEAIRCATLTPAEVLGVSAEVGTVEVGKRADLVILDADPTQDIHSIRRVHWTVSRGRVFAPQDLWSAVDFRTPSNSN
jgi:imidazolonepropionase-like amidohydrolase